MSSISSYLRLFSGLLENGSYLGEERIAEAIVAGSPPRTRLEPKQLEPNCTESPKSPI